MCAQRPRPGFILIAADHHLRAGRQTVTVVGVLSLLLLARGTLDVRPVVSAVPALFVALAGCIGPRALRFAVGLLHCACGVCPVDSFLFCSERLIGFARNGFVGVMRNCEMRGEC